MLKMVDGTGIIGVDMVCPLGGTVSPPQPPNYDRVELEGTGMLVLPNSLDAPLERLELGGKTEQVQTSGKNLLPDKFSIYAEGKSKTNLKLQIGNYVYSSKTSKNLYILHEDKSNITNGWTATNKFNFKIDKEETIEVRIETENPLEILPMIREETELDSYEPYTGGKPSPSPEYPQEIKNSGKWNEEKQKYEVSVKVTGKNLFDIEKAEVSGGNLCTAKRENNIVKITAIETVTSKRAYAIVSGGGIYLKSGKTYFLNGRKVGTSNMTPMFAFFKEKNNGELLKMGNFYTPNEDICIDIGIYLVGDAIRTGNTLEITDIIVCEGKDAAQYQPYTEQTITITSDRPITKWDKLVEQGGQIGWLYKSKIIDGFDGQSSNITLGGKQGEVQHFSVVFTDVPNGNGNGDIYVDRYRAIAMSYTKAEFGICCNWNSGVKFFSAPNENVTTVQEFKTWIVENPLKIAYETTNPEFIPLPQSEQNAIRALKTYYPTTVITADGGELDPDIKVTYTADTKNYIDGKVSAKVASILRQYQADTANLLSLMPMETQATMIENDTNNILNNLESEEAHE